MVSRAERKAAAKANSNPAAGEGLAMQEGALRVTDATPPGAHPEPFLANVVLEDEHDEDPADADPRDGSGVREAIALDEVKAVQQAARKAALLEAASYAEINWGNLHVAQGLREKAARL